MNDSGSLPPPDANEPSWRQILRELDVTPSRALGQNFLHDRKIVRRIVDVAEIGPETNVLEIGPGLGILTHELVQRAGSVVAVELDSRLAERLRNTYEDRLTLVEGDILDIDLDDATPKRDYVVVANLPYSIATAVVQRLFEAPSQPSRMIIMVQREVAERMAAKPPDMSILAVAVQFYSRPKIMFRIGAGAFIPRPRVESAVIRLDLHDETALPRESHDRFFAIVRAGFSQRRKRIDNSIAAGLGIPKNGAADRLNAAGIDPSRRAETLSVDDWVRLHRSFESEDND
jgi:16S rRNA (adenine1518-N6/adenine1519-N6)-dimethyltransferase